MNDKPKSETYAAAGVDISLKSKVISKVGMLAQATYRPEVASGVGPFSGLFEFKGHKDPLIVSSVDGVGTKIKIAIALDKHDTIGIDIVNHCVNDILTCGAQPLFFLDYIGTGKVDSDRIESIITGLSQACIEANCALISGEIAEMPGIYNGNDYDLVGFIVGVVEKEDIISGKTISAGDTIISLPSNGLHTNGYSLARKIMGDTREKLEIHYPELGKTAGEALLEPHRSYYTQVKPVLPLLKGISHITGSGIVGNLSRILPAGSAADLESTRWEVPPIFKLIQDKGNVETGEMYRVFNMGIGLMLICSPENAAQITEALPESNIVGKVVEQADDSRVIIDGIGYRQDKVLS
ncbi:phosphoribosylformylglycinamidine cyclo-ligase [Chloroflexota bacterium]